MSKTFILYKSEIYYLNVCHKFVVETELYRLQYFY